MAKPAKYVLLNGRKYREGSRAHVLEVARSAAVAKQQEKKRQPSIADLRGDLHSEQERNWYLTRQLDQEQRRRARLQVQCDALTEALLNRSINQASDEPPIPF